MGLGGGNKISDSQDNLLHYSDDAEGDPRDRSTEHAAARRCATLPYRCLRRQRSSGEGDTREDQLPEQDIRESVRCRLPTVVYVHSRVLDIEQSAQDAGGGGRRTGRTRVGSAWRGALAYIYMYTLHAAYYTHTYTYYINIIHIYMYTYMYIHIYAARLCAHHRL